jgi:hypothetical protein
MSELFAYLLRSGACLAMLYSFYRLILMKDANFGFNRAFLLGSAGLSLGLPLLRIESPFFSTVIEASELPLQSAPPPSLAPPAGLGPLDVLFGIYVAGAALFFVIFLARVGRLALMAARCGCERHRGLRIVLCGRAGESFSFFGFVFLDRSLARGGDIDRILAHEMAHVRQFHSLDVVLAEILTVIQWFNPFVWPYKRSLRESHEYLADRAVIAQGCSLARYKLLIVEQHVGGRLLELASGFRTSQIKRRIAMLTTQETRGLARWKPLLILPLAMAFVLAFAESRTVVQSGPDSIQTSVQSGQEGAGKGGGKPGTQTDEEMAKALKEKALQIEDMKKKNEETLAKLKEKLEATTDPDMQAKIAEAMKDQKLMSLEIGVKERMIQMKKLELEMSKEGDAVRKAELEKKILQLKAESEDYQKKVEQLRKQEQARKAEEKAKQGAEKK